MLLLVPRRTSNAYSFRDPEPQVRAGFPKSQNSTGTTLKTSSSFLEAGKVPALDPSKPLEAMLIRLGKAVGTIPDSAKEARG